MKYILSALILCCVTISLLAQQQTSVFPSHRTCGASEHLHHQMNKYPTIKKRQEQMQRKTQKWIKEQGALPRAKYTIPVVFHVVYNNADENIQDKYIYAQLEQLNADFQALNSDYNDVPAEFSKGNPNIEFCLAKLDPNGNPTTGITRTETTATSFTVSGDRIKKSYSKGVKAWDTKKYFNIWIGNIKSNTSDEAVLGYAQFPQSYEEEPETDGLVLLYSTVGSLDVPNPEGKRYNKGRTATHELGHCLGLYHIWGDDTNDNDASDDCSGSDKISDTPNQEGPSGGCPVYPTRSCGSNDMTMNYMDYSNDACMYAFTKGQAAQMAANLNSYAHLKSKIEAAPYICGGGLTASLSNSINAGCAPLKVSFTDNSFGAPNTWVWTFEGGQPESFVGQTPPTVTFATAGEYEVSLAVSNDTATNIVTKMITVSDCSQLECFSVDNLYGKPLVLVQNNATGSGAGGYVSGHNGFNDVAVAEHFTNVGANGKLDGIEFNFGYAEGTTGNVEFFIWSDDNGKPSTILQTEVISFETIKSHVDNKQKTLVTFGGLQDVPNNFFVGFKMGSGYKLALYSNSDGDTNPTTAWTLLSDNVTWVPFDNGTDASWEMNLSLAISPKFCFPTSLKEIQGLEELEVRPNPVLETLQVYFSTKESMDLELEIFDILGKKVINSRSIKGIGETTETIDASNLPSGTYFVRLSNGDRASTTRFMKM